MPEFKRPGTLEDLEHSFQQIKPYMNPTMAHYESARCLFCYDAPCVKACPTGIDIPLFIRQIHTHNTEGAARTIYDSNYFGNVCGKVCPTEVLCEGACVYNHQNVKPIEIGRLQSYATSQVIENKSKLYELAAPNGKKVAVVGAGPAGIACACELMLLGYEVEVFEAKAQPSGLALYGCAPYKVTNEDVLNEVDWLQEQFGFRLHLNRPVQTADQWKQLENDYDAVFLGIGLGNTQAAHIPGEQLENVVGATEYIAELKLNPLSTRIGEKVVVIGGGNTAMDAASESARLGAEEVTLAYRRSKEEMKAYEFEYELAKSVGVKGMFNVAPMAILGENRVEGIRLAMTRLEAGRVQILSETAFEIPCDTVILATGQEKMTALLAQIEGVGTDRQGRISVNKATYQTGNPKYFAGGDAVNGGAEVVNAAAEGKAAAQGIHSFLHTT
jgi:dihydropyrimidine dehydrogenase (NAD+) subunit PreT